jgi:hypothetical protein
MLVDSTTPSAAAAARRYEETNWETLLDNRWLLTGPTCRTGKNVFRVVTDTFNGHGEVGRWRTVGRANADEYS